MTPTIFWSLYWFCALAQAILAVRYLFNDKDKEDGAVFMVVMMTVFAPFVSIFLICGSFYLAVMWLVTYKSPKVK